MSARRLTDDGPSPLHVLSQKSAHVLVTKSPLHARLRKLRHVPDDITDEMDLGTVVHEILLGKGRGFAVAEYTEPTADEQLAALVEHYEETGDLPEEPAEKPKKGRKKKAPEPPPIAKESGRPEWQNWLRGDAKAAREAIRARGLVPLLPKQHRIATAGAKKLRAACEAMGFPFSGESEVSIEWPEFATGGDEVTCWGALDHLMIYGQDRAVIYDLKILDSAHPRSVQRYLLNFGGDIQSTAYIRAVEALYPALAGRVEFVFLACELLTGCVTPVLLGGGMRRLGEMRWRRAVDTWARCLREDNWPGYVTEPVTVDAPEWALTEEMGRLDTTNRERGERFLMGDDDA